MKKCHFCFRNRLTYVAVSLRSCSGFAALILSRYDTEAIAFSGNISETMDEQQSAEETNKVNGRSFFARRTHQSLQLQKSTAVPAAGLVPLLSVALPAPAHPIDRSPARPSARLLDCLPACEAYNKFIKTQEKQTGKQANEQRSAVPTLSISLRLHICCRKLSYTEQEKRAGQVNAYGAILFPRRNDSVPVPSRTDCTSQFSDSEKID